MRVVWQVVVLVTDAMSEAYLRDYMRPFSASLNTAIEDMLVCFSWSREDIILSTLNAVERRWTAGL